MSPGFPKNTIKDGGAWYLKSSELCMYNVGLCMNRYTEGDTVGGLWKLGTRYMAPIFTLNSHRKDHFVYSYLPNNLVHVLHILLYFCCLVYATCFVNASLHIYNVHALYHAKERLEWQIAPRTVSSRQTLRRSQLLFRIFYCYISVIWLVNRLYILHSYL